MDDLPEHESDYISTEFVFDFAFENLDALSDQELWDFAEEIGRILSKRRVEKFQLIKDREDMTK